MIVYYREVDSVWIGDLTFIRLSDEGRKIADYERKQWPEKYPSEVTLKPYSSFLTFDTAWRDVCPRKFIHIEDPFIKGFGHTGIDILDKDGNEYKFYTSKPEWVKESIFIPTWAKVNKSPEEIEEERIEREESKKLSDAFASIDWGKVMSVGDLDDLP